jgi:hypothetical protein
MSGTAGQDRTTVEDVRTYVEGLGGVLTLAPGPGDGTPELAWGDLFFYEAPDGVVPPGQPFATVVTKDYPGEPASGLGDGSFRVNVGASAEEFERWAGDDADRGPTTRDAVMAHPTYAAQRWLCVVDPGPGAWPSLQELLAAAHARARARRERRAQAGGGEEPADG